MSKEKLKLYTNPSVDLAQRFFYELDKKRKLLFYHIVTHPEDIERLVNLEGLEQAIGVVREIYGKRAPSDLEAVIVEYVLSLQGAALIDICFFASTKVWTEKRKEHPLIAFVWLLFHSKAERFFEKCEKINYDERSSTIEQINKLDTGIEDDRPASNVLYSFYLSGMYVNRYDIPSTMSPNFSLVMSELLVTHATKMLRDYAASVMSGVESDYATFWGEIEKLRAQLSEKDGIITDFKNEVKKLKEKKNASASAVSQEALKAKDETIKSLKETIAQLNKAFGAVKGSAKSDTYKTLYEKTDEKLKEAKQLSSQRKKEIRDLEKKVKKLEERTALTMLHDYLRDHGGCTDELRAILEQFKIIEPPTPVEQESLQVAGVEPERPKKTQRIGYVNYHEDGKYYMTFADKTSTEITVPEHMYPIENQFGYIDENDRLVYLFPQVFENTGRELPTFGFVGVNFKSGVPSFFKNDHFISGVNSRNNIQWRRNSMVILVDAADNVIRFYKAAIMNADVLMPAVEARGHKMYYIVKKLSSGWLMKDVKTGEDLLKPLVFKDEEHQIEERNVVIVNQNDEVTRVIPQSRTYTTSSYYNGRQRGVIVIENEQVFIKKESGEKVLVSGIPAELYLQEGEVIEVDEHNEYCAKLDTSDTLLPHRPMLSPQKEKRSEPADKKEVLPVPIVDKPVLIIGNEGLRSSYETALAKVGLRAITIDGYDPYLRLSSEYKNACCIIVVTKFVSHGNMWGVKNEIKAGNITVPVKYAEHDGTNRIAELALETVKATMEQSNSMVS